MTQYTIGQVAKIVGLSEKTIRFYEDEHLLSPISRKTNGYRSYSPTIIEELKLLKHVRDLGLPLVEIKKLMKGCGHGTCHHEEKYIENTIDNYLALLSEKIDQLKNLKTKMTSLKDSVIKCKRDNAEKEFCCDILHQLINLDKKGGEKNESNT